MHIAYRDTRHIHSQLPAYEQDNTLLEAVTITRTTLLNLGAYRQIGEGTIPLPLLHHSEPKLIDSRRTCLFNESSRDPSE